MNPPCGDNYLDSTVGQCLDPLHLHGSNLLSLQSSDPQSPGGGRRRSSIAEEETKIEKAIVATIAAGGVETLKPNSGEAVAIGEHYVCVSFQEEKDSEYRVWEWHGHVVSYDEEGGYAQDYVYGNYFERTTRGEAFCDEIDDSGEEADAFMGLKGLIGGLNLKDGRILCRFDRLF